MAYASSSKLTVEEYNAESPAGGFVPDELFIESWEQYLAEEHLEEEHAAFAQARSRFLSRIGGPLAAEWMRQSARLSRFGLR
jgi:hypothetical protein